MRKRNILILVGCFFLLIVCCCSTIAFYFATLPTGKTTTIIPSPVEIPVSSPVSQTPSPIATPSTDVKTFAKDPVIKLLGNTLNVVGSNYALRIEGLDGVEINSAVLGAEDCYHSHSVDVTFKDSDVLLLINPCGLGGISQESVGSIEEKAATGENFDIGINNCIRVEESFQGSNAHQDYVNEVNTVGTNCRSYFGGYVSKDASDKINFLTMFIFTSTKDKQAKDTATINEVVKNISFIKAF